MKLDAAAKSASDNLKLIQKQAKKHEKAVFHQKNPQKLGQNSDQYPLNGRTIRHKKTPLKLIKGV